MTEEKQYSETGEKPAPSGGQADIPTIATPPVGFVPPEPAELARQFPQLEILELLGQGGMGVVYKARQQQLDRLVALKILPPQVDQNKAFAERFTREARSLARLNHTRIVMIYDFGHTESGLYYFIMEFVDGTDLRNVIKKSELSPGKALKIVPQICEALQYAHEEGVVHRDIKPENILLNKKGQVKIADFGLAKILGMQPAVYTLTRTDQKMGTPHYMAPEQIERPQMVDHRADIYSLGVVFYEMLTGELPLGRFPLPSKKVRVDVRLDEIVLKTLEKEPELRYQHASEVKTDVETISSEDRAARAEGETFEGFGLDGETEAIRQRVWIPAVGLLIAGVIDCLSSAGAVVGTIILLIQKGFSGRFLGFLPGSAQLVIVVAMAAHAVIVVSGAWNLMQLRSRRMAMAGSVLAMLPFSPGAVVGLPMGIWALLVMTRKRVKSAFGRKKTETVIGPKFRAMAVSAAEDIKEVLDRGKAEADRIIGAKNASLEHHDSKAPGKTFRKAFGSFILGLASLLFASFKLGLAGRSIFVFLPAFFAVFLGVNVLRTVQSYRDHLLAVGLAIVGIIAGLISGSGLFVTVM
ncbi:MAG: serine/threonine protein kinase [Sedimentisphaerales bacterium]|nr:serine/threonine protein kinase [Sedimentisphaerales bacterium]